MRYTVQKSLVSVVGRIWQGLVCGQEIPIDDHGIQSLLEASGAKDITELTREHIAEWLTTHAGDFQSITDFRADLSYLEKDFLSDWATEDGEIAFMDAMYPAEE